jgi:hypothetical protein
VLTVVVQLDGELLPQSKVLSTLEQIFIRELCSFALFIFASILTSLPVPAAEKHPHSMMLPPPFRLAGLNDKVCRKNNRPIHFWEYNLEN